MKKYMFMLFAALAVAGCSQDDSLLEEEPKSEMVTVSLNLGGDITSEESPITRADTESRDLIGIAVYKGTQLFACGIFDNLSNVTINLLTGAKYRFKCTLIKEAKDKLYFYTTAENSLYRFYYTFPFQYQTICNQWFYTIKSTQSEFLDVSYVSITKSDSKDYCRAIDRFYGEVNDYTPTVNGVVNIDLKRVSFGLKVKVSGITDGSAAVTIKNNYNTFASLSGLSTAYEGAGEMFSMYNITDAWKYADIDYQEQIQVSVVWTRGIGIKQDLGTKTINVKRNAMNIVHIKLSSDDSDVDVGVDPEEGDMGDEDEDLNT